MERLESPDAMRAWRRQHRQALGFVPTMGALHRGHLSLVARAREAAEQVVASIFINPIQFDDQGDLDAYPVDLEADCAALERIGVDAVFLPRREDIYPEGYCTFVEVVGPLVDKLCGAARPGHFRGVTTVICKLFNLVQPDSAVFGEKDLQQALIVERMVRDLCLPVEVIVAPTVREADGLALSSRNRRLEGGSRQKAASLARGLDRANTAFRNGERNSLKLLEPVYDELLVHPGVDVDYADVIRVAGFQEVETAAVGDVLAVAAFIDGVRLIDHTFLGGPQLVPAGVH